MPSSDLLFYPEMASEMMKNTSENNFLIEGAVRNALEMSSELIICKWRLNWCLYSESQLEHERELEKVYMKPPIIVFGYWLVSFLWDRILLEFMNPIIFATLIRHSILLTNLNCLTWNLHNLCNSKFTNDAQMRSFWVSRPCSEALQMDYFFSCNWLEN